ncbi:M23 family metallopeptidase [Streptomyces acidiscabies]|uniref:M23 family metallopeptidase n=1 Tax=Streptomyces acidiscabies TaxID=42234 RepID=UPI00067D74C2|nr:M23 family metallopeptidase [Streptomyces acidiscabies]
MHKALYALLLLLPPTTTWPVTPHPPILRPYTPPPTPYAAGHRGVDLSTPPGTPVRAVAQSRVTFAGQVAGKGVITLELTATGLHTTYEPVQATVTKGEEVEEGEIIGKVEPTGTHCTTPCLHWGLKQGNTYLNPLSLLPRTPPRLLPYLNTPLPRTRSASSP